MLWDSGPARSRVNTVLEEDLCLTVRPRALTHLAGLDPAAASLKRCVHISWP